MSPAASPSAVEVSQHKWYRLPLSDDQRDELDSAVHAYFRNAESSAKGMGFRDIAVILGVLYVCKFPVGTLVALIEGDFFVCIDGEEPHPLLLSKGHPDSPGPMGDNASDMDWYDACNSQPCETGKTWKKVRR